VAGLAGGWTALQNSLLLWQRSAMLRQNEQATAD
jgi:hypothetical protein